METMDSEVARIKELCNSKPFTMVMFLTNWNKDLPPWEADPVMGDEPFGKGAPETLAFITEQVIPAVAVESTKEIILGGYSLAGLFTLWAAYQTDVFTGVAAASPSVWYPGWDTYSQEQEIKTGNIYLSLGTKEEKTRHPLMKTVGDNIRRQAECLQEDPNSMNVTLEMNPGNHFKEPDLRMAKGFAWVMNK